MVVYIWNMFFKKGEEVKKEMQKWQPELPVKKYADEIAEHFVFIAYCLLAELKNDSYDWEFIPVEDKSFDSQKKRTKNSRPVWYQNLLDARRPIHKRKRTIRAINRLIALSDGRQNGQRYIYDRMIREIAFKRLTDGFKDISFYPPENEVRKYFGLEIEPMVECEKTTTELKDTCKEDIQIEEMPLVFPFL